MRPPRGTVAFIGVEALLRAAFASLSIVLTTAAIAAPQAVDPPAVTPTTPAPVTTPVATVKTVPERLAAVSEELAAVRQALDALPPDTPSPRRSALESERDLLARIELQLNQHQTADANTIEWQRRKDEATPELDRIRMSGPDTPPPYSVLQVDQLRDELEKERARVNAVAAAVTAASSAVTDATQALERAESARRRAAEAEKTNNDDARRGELALASRMAVLESRIAEETLALRKTELTRESLTQDLLNLGIDSLTARIDWMSKTASFSPADLETKRLEIETARSKVKQRLSAAESTLGYLERDWFDAKRRLDTTSTPALVEEVAARRLAFDAARETVDALNKRLEYLTDAMGVWTRRLELTRRPVAATLFEWRDESNARIDAMNLESSVLSARAEEVRTRIGAISERLESMEPGAEDVSRWLREQQRHLRTMSETIAGRIQAVDSARRLHTRLLNAIGISAENIPLTERLGAVWKSVIAVWQFEFWSVEENPITVGKAIIGIFVLFFGLFASRRLSRFIGRRVLPRFRLNEGASAAIQSILFYVLAVTFVLLAFRAVNVPLTAFTVLGGALAIGVGFGSQNIIANFISGLILIAERPVRVGDLVEVNGLHGTVEHLGARSTRIRTGSNVEIVVPNSAFLEQNVINWTLSEDKIRTSVTVGVAYGSPTREVTKLIMRAAEEHGRIHKKPTPIVLFTEFGDNALIFEVHFWITMKKLMDRRSVESDLRYRIDSLFHEAGIVIAFPQRDVHLDSLSPVEVRIVDGTTAGTTAVLTAGTAAGKAAGATAGPNAQSG